MTFSIGRVDFDHAGVHFRSTLQRGLDVLFLLGLTEMRLLTPFTPLRNLTWFRSALLIEELDALQGLPSRSTSLT